MIIIETFLICDGGCGRSYGVDNRSLTGNEHRLHAKSEGWKLFKRKDYCPECAEKLPKEGKKYTSRYVPNRGKFS